MTNVSAITSGELLSLYSGVLVELRRRGLVRTANNPAADLGERLVCDAMGWLRESEQRDDFDATTRAGARVRIKSRRQTRDASPIRSGSIHDKDGFDILALVFFASDFSVDKAVIVPREAALRHLRWSKRQKGWYVGLTQRFWLDPDIEDVTSRIALCHRDLLDRTS